MATYKSIRYLVPDEVVEHTDSINALADVNTSTVAPEIGQTLKWSAANSRWQPADIEESGFSASQKGMFGFGDSYPGGRTNETNRVSSTGVVASAGQSAGTARSDVAASGYGNGKAIFGFGRSSSSNAVNMTNLVSTAGVIASDTTGIGTARYGLAAAGFGGDKAIFGFGYENQNITNLVSNAGVVATDTTGVGTGRKGLAGASYGGDKALFGFGAATGSDGTNVTNLVSNAGVVSTDTTGVGQARYGLTAAGYGEDKAIFGFGFYNDGGSFGVTSRTNLVSNLGVVATDTTGVASSREMPAGIGYGGDKAIFGFGNYYEDYQFVYTNVTNLVSNTGIVATDTTGVGTARSYISAAGYSTTA